MATVTEATLRSVRTLPGAHYAVALVTDEGRALSFDFSRIPASHGGFEIVAPEDLRFPEGSISSLGTFLYRIVGLFHQLVAEADAPVTAMSAGDEKTQVLLSYTAQDAGQTQLAFRLPPGPLTPAGIPLSASEQEAAAELGLSNETVGRALYAFGSQLREPIQIIAPDE